MADPMRVLGLMSGTSVDGIDAALCEFAPDPAGGPGALAVRLLHFQAMPLPPAIRQRVLALCRPATSRIDDLTEMSFVLGDLFAEAALAACAAARPAPGDLDLIASHGQTVYHLVEPGRRVATLQIGQPAVIAARTGVTTIADLRVADVAAGGQGAPLVSFFDALFFRDPTRHRALQNIGGIGNVTFVAPDGTATAFDTGPGNSLIDYAARRYSGGARPYDVDGQMARAGQVHAGLLAELLAEPYYALPPPKTTGRELFGDTYGAGVVERAEAAGLAPADVVATLTALTARTIADAYARFGPAAGAGEVIVAGGGARNPALLDMLRAALPPGVPIALHDAYGLPAKAKEATVFALLGYAGLHGCPATLPSCTGAARPAVPGAITPGANYRRLLARVAATPTEELCPIQSLRLIS
jgi:anhydro-N-acetylmuramic acid kinase